MVLLLLFVGGYLLSKKTNIYKEGKSRSKESYISNHTSQIRRKNLYTCMSKEEFEDTKVVILIRILKKNTVAKRKCTKSQTTIY